MSKELIIVRHSERIDEVDANYWCKKVREIAPLTWRDTNSILNDPPITGNGVALANTAASSIKQFISAKDATSEVRVYTSKLIRSVQTAYQIALQLHVPLYVCTGLALTAAAVGEANGLFQFVTVEEIKDLCPGVEIICCDDSALDHHVPATHWLSAITAIANRDHTNIIVAHRETIRNLCTYRVKTPYCCIALVNYNPSEEVRAPSDDKTIPQLQEIKLPEEEGSAVDTVFEWDGVRTPRSNSFSTELSAHKLHTILDMHGSVIEEIHHSDCCTEFKPPKKKA